MISAAFRIIEESGEIASTRQTMVFMSDSLKAKSTAAFKPRGRDASSSSSHRLCINKGLEKAC
jgi:hypothetical protein